ncbi:MAG TPA: hypothetical protein VGM52_09595 [Herbaspirillum sp.]|jgi:hypothetical protein
MNADKLEINNRKLDAAQPAGQHAGADELRQRREEYMAALTAHFQSYVNWASDQWPIDATPLALTSFDRSREDLNAIRCQLGLPAPDSNADPSAPGATQFIPVTPMPWP